MINSVGQTISSAIEASKLREGGKARAASTISGSSAKETSASPSPTARMAAQGAPVDAERISAIKAAIASGNYPVDPGAIADRMLALDLPTYG